jgi:hypothetical protein
MEWADDVILVHFKNQGTRIFIWQGGGKYRERLPCFVRFCITLGLTSMLLSTPAVFITCSTLHPRDSSVTRIMDFVDRGCSRPEVMSSPIEQLVFNTKNGFRLFYARIPR